MANFVERFNQFIDYTGLTPYKLAKEIGTSDVIISKIKAGKNKPSFDFLEKIVFKYSIVNINWLITGEGDMIKNKPDESGINGGVIAINEGENDSFGVKSGGNPGVLSRILSQSRHNMGVKSIKISLQIPSMLGRQAVFTAASIPLKWSP
jgi:hypothetical protein